MNQAAKRPAKSNGKARTVATVPAGDGSSVILVANPRKSPWPRFDHLAVDIGAALGLRDWVAAFDERKQRWYVGQVEDLQQSFTINRRDNLRSMGRLCHDQRSSSSSGKQGRLFKRPWPQHHCATWRPREVGQFTWRSEEQQRR
jgi:hypothetical protein